MWKQWMQIGQENELGVDVRIVLPMHICGDIVHAERE